SWSIGEIQKILGRLEPRAECEVSLLDGDVDRVKPGRADSCKETAFSLCTGDLLRMSLDVRNAAMTEFDEIICHLASGREIIDPHIESVFVQLAHRDSDERHSGPGELGEYGDRFRKRRRKDDTFNVGRCNVARGLRLIGVPFAFTGF